MDEPIFYDTDCLSSFITVGKEDLLKKLFPRIIISDVVKKEFDKLDKSNIIVKGLNKLIEDNFVEIEKLRVNTKEFELYFNFITNEGNETLNGEFSVIALTIVNNGILASNNFTDVCYYVKKYNLKHISTSKIIVKCFDEGIITENEAINMWDDMINNNIYLPEKSFKTYYAKEDKMCYN